MLKRNTKGETLHIFGLYDNLVKITNRCKKRQYLTKIILKQLTLKLWGQYSTSSLTLTRYLPPLMLNLILSPPYKWWEADVVTLSEMNRSQSCCIRCKIRDQRELSYLIISLTSCQNSQNSLRNTNFILESFINSCLFSSRKVISRLSISKHTSSIFWKFIAKVFLQNNITLLQKYTHNRIFNISCSRNLLPKNFLQK